MSKEIAFLSTEVVDCFAPSVLAGVVIGRRLSLWGFTNDY